MSKACFMRPANEELIFVVEEARESGFVAGTTNTPG